MLEIDSDASSSPNPVFCLSCGGASRPGARFCRSCGASLTQSGSSSAPPEAVIPAASGNPAGQQRPPSDQSGEPLFAPSRPSIPISPMGPRFDRRTLTILGGVFALVVLVVGAGLLLTRKPAGAGGGQAKTLYVNRLLHLRSAPGATGSAVLGDLHRGDTVTGIVITGSDGVTQWLKISGNGQPDRFVWAKNLSPTRRPPLSSNTEADLLFANQAAALAEPNSAAPVIETEAAGATVHETGEVAGGWYEIELARGGVGYVLKSSVPPTSATAATSARAGAGAQPLGSTLALWTDQTTFNPSAVLRKDVSAGLAWHNIVPKKYINAKWVYDLEGTFNPPKVMSEGGITYVVGGACKPYDCGGNNVFYVIEPGGNKAYGAVFFLRSNVPSYEYFGKAGPLQHEWLREEIVDTEHALSIKGLVR
jgi:hypothetical protein